MAKREIIKNDALTVRVAAPPVHEVLESTMDVVEETLDTLEGVGSEVAKVSRNNPYVIAGVVVVTAGVAGYVGYRIAKKRMEKANAEEVEQVLEDARLFYTRLHKDGPEMTPEALAEKLVPLEKTSEMQKLHSILEQTQYVDPTARVEISGWDQEAENMTRELLDEDTPFIISHLEFLHGETEHNQSTLTYYAEDDVLVDERDQPIPNPDRTVGEDTLVKFGHGSDSPDSVYVRNPRTEMEYEIVRSNGSYSADVLGIVRHSDEPRRRKSRRGQAPR